MLSMPLRNDLSSVLVIGSGPIVIGQAAEFDYAGTQACFALKEEGLRVVLINNNPATIMTDPSTADSIYIEPLTLTALEGVIKAEKPDGIIGTLGGQTGLNLVVEAFDTGLLDRYAVEVLGTSVDSIRRGEDRELFRQSMLAIGEPIPESSIVRSVEEGLAFAETVGYPLIVRPAYTLGGTGGGFANSEAELRTILRTGLRASPIGQALVEESIKGWKEIEYEVMRDANDTCITVCSMENLDPVGVHTGDSIVVAPAQTLNDREYQMLRRASLRVIRALSIVGGCNIQFALDPFSENYRIIEVNPRVSRSSALASKAAGYPIARIAAKCSIGYHLDEIINPITGGTMAAFEPALDYVVVKLPRFPFDKFTEADHSLGTQMKATGEVMAIDRSFEGALQKGLRSLDVGLASLYLPAASVLSDNDLLQAIQEPTDTRLFALAEGLRRGWSLERLRDASAVDPWFLSKLQVLVNLEESLRGYTWQTVPKDLLWEAKQKNTADSFLASIYGVSEPEIRALWQDWGWQAGYKAVDTCAGEFEATTPYFYSTWLGVDEVEPGEGQQILVLGSGPIRIGQGIEFDYCSVQAASALRRWGYRSVVINNNPETVSTDFSAADRLYFEPLAVEDILRAAEKEQVVGVMVQFSGQTGINAAKELSEAGLKVFGTDIAAIDQLEDRHLFYELLGQLDVPHIEGETVRSTDELLGAVARLGYPILVRPSYVIGGQAMFVFYRQNELLEYAQTLQRQTARMWPLLVDRFVPGRECEVDVVSDGKDILIPGIFEHIEPAGVHSGDSISVFPALTLSPRVRQTIVDYTQRVAQAVPIVGAMNIQFVVHDETVFCLEVNPRASRTVPIISKVTGVPIVELAVRVQLGHTLKDAVEQVGLCPEPAFYSVKAPVFSTSKLRHVDFVLGPEMKSTGETLGLGVSFAEALGKSMGTLGASLLQPQDGLQAVFLSVPDRDKPKLLPLAAMLVQRGFRLTATPGTAAFLKAHSVPAVAVTMERPAIDEALRGGDMAAVINVPTQGRLRDRMGFFLREQAVGSQIPLFTCLETVKAVLSLPQAEDWHVWPLNVYQALTSQKGMVIDGKH